MKIVRQSPFCVLAVVSAIALQLVPPAVAQESPAAASAMVYETVQDVFYFWRMMLVAGHTHCEIKELQGYHHGQMAEPAHPLLLRFVEKTAAAQ